MNRIVVAFRKDRATGKTHPITKSVSKLNQKKVVVKSRGFKGVAPSTEVARLAKREYNVLKKHAKKIDLAGSIRRRKPDPSDIDFVIIPKNAEAKQAIYKHAEKYEIRARGEQLLSYWLLPRKRAQVDIYFAEPQYYGSMLLFATGPGEYNIALRAKAIAQNLKLNQYGVFKGNKCLGSRTERDVYDALLYPYKSPELRGLSDKEAEKRFGAKPGQRVLRRLRVGNEDEKEISLKIKSLIKNFGCSSFKINAGQCDEFAEALIKVFPKALILSTGFLRGEATDWPGHTYVKINRKYYDAETSEGVTNELTLPKFAKFHKAHPRIPFVSTEIKSRGRDRTKSSVLRKR